MTDFALRVSAEAAAIVLNNKEFLKISQNLQENTCVRVSLMKLQDSQPATLVNKTLWLWCFPVNFSKFVRALYNKELW